MRSQLPANLERVREQARLEWLERGTCGAHELLRCENGHQELNSSDGYSYWTTAYDRDGRLEFDVSGGCLGEMHRAGSRPECPTERTTLVRDLCVESLDGLESRGFEIELGCGRASRLTRIFPGTTRLELAEGVMLRFEVPLAPRKSFDIVFDSAPPGVELIACTDACSSLDAGQSLTSQQLTVMADHHATRCDLYISRFFVAAADAGVSASRKR